MNKKNRGPRWGRSGSSKLSQIKQRNAIQKLTPASLYNTHKVD